MKRVFADSFFYFALLNSHDRAHRKAVEFLESFSGEFITTTWIMTELGDGLCAPENRQLFLELHQTLRSDPEVLIVEPTLELYDLGLAFYAARLDKEWSFTDCVSFVVMQQHGIREAITGDHHFEQAGFKALLK